MSNIEVVYIQCATKGCGHSPFPVAKQFDARCRRTHETFYCPGGHSLWYSGKSDEERLKEDNHILKRRLEDAEWRLDALRRHVHRCPWIGCGFVAHPANDFDMRAMWSHLRSAHGMPTRAEFDAEQEALLNEKEA